MIRLWKKLCRINAASAKNPSAAALTNRTAPGKLNWMSFCRWWPPKSCWDPSCSPVQEMSAQSARTARSQGTRAVCHHTKGQCLSQQNLALTWRNCDIFEDSWTEKQLFNDNDKCNVLGILIERHILFLWSKRKQLREDNFRIDAWKLNAAQTPGGIFF